ncbi:MAG: NAD(P)/FAD-dependent oxidoreductase, partial [Leptospiraceae bacterium]|nr:NAD(P)/FAD-dependent oxidoreductase [Leptospiraceae bacterium]
MTRAIGIVGSGPAGLMAASVLASHGLPVTVFEKNKGPGRKLLIAGASGLNITNSLSEEDFAAQYEGNGIDWRKLLRDFSPTDWLAFIHRLGLETFLGTSGRYFVREMKASGLLRRWIDDLREKKVRFQY